MKLVFAKTKRHVMDGEPSITKILETPMLQDDRSLLFQLFEIYKCFEDATKERLEIRKDMQEKFEQAQTKFSQYSKYTNKQHDRFTAEIQEIEDYDENSELKYDILSLSTSLTNKKVIYNQYKRFMRMDTNNDEHPKLNAWLSWAMRLPYDRMTKIPYTDRRLSVFLRKVSKTMDEELYGMHKVKEQILLFLNTRILNPGLKKASLGLIGPPGTGKTHIARLLAKVSNYPFVQISLGGVKNSDYIKGHQYTYIGSQPGQIVKCLAEMGTKNGILYIDELEKCSDEVASSILHVTDPSQNSEYTDNFLSGIQIDLSSLWFFYSMNSVPSNSALSDRIHCIELPGYTQHEKCVIVKDYLVKRAHISMGWEDNRVVFDDEAVVHLVETVSPPTDPGVRSLDHAVVKITSKINFIKHHQNNKGKLIGFNTSFELSERISFPYTVSKDKLELFLL